MLRNIARGDRGNDVLAVQQGLNIRKLRDEPKVDEIGVFGPATDAAVRRFQRRTKLKDDGVVGNRTRAALFPLAVVTVQAVGVRPGRPDPVSLALDADPSPPPSVAL